MSNKLIQLTQDSDSDISLGNSKKLNAHWLAENNTRIAFPYKKRGQSPIENLSICRGLRTLY